MLRIILRQYRIIALVILFSLLLNITLSPTFAQQNNVCRDQDAPIINYGDTLEGVVVPAVPEAYFCFEAERGTNVSITIEPITQNLFTTLIVGTPFVDNEGFFADEPLLVQDSPAQGGAYQGSVSISSDGTYLIAVQGAANVQGIFLITLELSGGNVLGSLPTEDDDTVEETGTEEVDSASETSSGGISNIVPGETNLCTTIYSNDIAYGDTVEGTADQNPLFYCFEASEGDIVTINFTIEEAPLGYIVVDPFYDGSANALSYSQGFAQTPSEEVSSEFFVEISGQYAILIGATTETAGNFTLSISSEAGTIYDCQNEPLNTLISRTWGLVDDSGVSIIEVNVSCGDRLSISTFGGSAIGIYDITQDDEFFFVYQNVVYITTSLTEDEWVFQPQGADHEYTLQALTDGDACTTGDIATLIQGSWFWEIDQTQQIYFDFTCNGLVIIDDSQNEPFAAPYTLEEGTITIPIGQQTIVFENVAFGEGVLSVEFTDFNFELQDLNYNAPDDN